MKKIKIAVAGIGVVGSNVVKSLAAKKAYFSQKFNVEIVGISSRTKKDLPFKWYENAIDMIDSEQPDIVCELIGGDSGIAHDIAIKTLSESRVLITANKALLAKEGENLLSLARDNKTKLFFEAAVGGAVPIIQTISSNLNFNEIFSFGGILNGTANYILTKMHEDKQNLADVIKIAQDLGLAESDPTFDICGIDASQKLAIINSLIYGVNFDVSNFTVTGIDKITLDDIKAAESFGAKIKLVASSELIDNTLYSRVSPVFCSKENFLFSIDNALNAASFKTDMATDMTLISHGAGGIQTAHAVITDIQASLSGIDSPRQNNLHKINNYQSLEFSGSLIVKTNEVNSEFNNNVKIGDYNYYLVENMTESNVKQLFSSDTTIFLHQ
jgi:homoserine dehydrogenase